MEEWELKQFIGELLTTKTIDYTPEHKRLLATLHKVLTNFLKED